MSKKTKKEKVEKPKKELTPWPTRVKLESSIGNSREYDFVSFRRGCIEIMWGLVGGRVKFFLTTGYLYPRGNPRHEANWRIDWDQLRVLRKCAKERGWKGKLVVEQPYRDLVGDGRLGCEIARYGAAA